MKKYRVWRKFLGIALALTAAGCGGGGGSPPPPPAVIADTAQAWWVGETGDKWAYVLTDTRGNPSAQPVFKTVDDIGTTTISGKTARLFRHSWSLYGAAPETEVRYYDGASIRRIELDPADLSGNTLIDYPEVPAPLLDGATRTLADESVQVDLNGDGLPETIRVQILSTLHTQPTLSLAAGDFRNVLVGQLDAVATVTVGGSGQSMSATSTVTSWYAPGIGVIRRAFKDPNYAAPYDTSVEELAGVSTTTVKAGIVPGVTAMGDGLGFASQMVWPHLPAAASGGGRMMTVAAAQSGSIEGVLQAGDGSIVWRGTVLYAGAPYLLTNPTVCFDGAGFRVYAVQTIPYNSPTQYSVMSQRVSLDAALRGPVAGLQMATGVADGTQTLAQLRCAAGNGTVMLAWGRFDTSYVQVAPGIMQQVGYVIDGRVFDANDAPLAPMFELGKGLPSAAAAHGTQFLLADDANNGTDHALHAWAVNATGAPESTTPVVVSDTLLLKGQVQLQTVGPDTWVSFSEWNTATGPTNVSPATIRVAPLGTDAALLSGTTSAPGRALTTQPSERSGNLLAIGSGNVLLAWSQGYADIAGTVADSSTLTGPTAWPTTVTTLTVPVPGGYPAPASTLAYVADSGSALVAAWVSPGQAPNDTSDRIEQTFIFARYVAP